MPSIVVHWINCFGSDGDLVFRGATFAILELAGSKTLGSEKPKHPPGKPDGIQGPKTCTTCQSPARRPLIQRCDYRRRREMRRGQEQRPRSRDPKR